MFANDIAFGAGGGNDQEHQPSLWEEMVESAEKVNLRIRAVHLEWIYARIQ